MGMPSSVNHNPKMCRSASVAGNIRFLIVGQSVNAINIKITTTVRGVKMACRRSNQRPIESAVMTMKLVNYATLEMWNGIVRNGVCYFI